MSALLKLVDVRLLQLEMSIKSGSEEKSLGIIKDLKNIVSNIRGDD